MRGLPILVIPVFASLAFAQCTTATQNFPDATMTDTNQHTSLGHSAATGIFDIANPGGRIQPGTDVVGTCAYTDPGNGAVNCNTTCSVALNGSPSTSERGGLNATGSHEPFQNWVSGQSATAGGGASCAGALGGGAANCGPGGCQSGFLTVNVTPSGGGFSTTASIASLAGGTQIWAQASSPFTLTCTVRQVHPNGGGGGGGTVGTGCTSVQPKGSGPINELIRECNPGTSPIIIDTEGEGFHLTSADAGVNFDIRGDGHPIQMAWTDAQFHNAFLALPGPDGLVHNGKELFGNFTPQPPSAHPNGFLALAEFDKTENGGNNDGVMDKFDAVFSRLRLWIDENHDGVCQPQELHRLPDLGIYSLSLSYFKSSRTDEFGNQFRYNARVNPGERRESRDETPTDEPGRWAYDVFFTHN